MAKKKSLTTKKNEPLFHSWSNAEEHQQAVSQYASDMYDDASLSQSTAFTGRTFLDTDDNISVKSDFGRNDYEYYRPSSTVPKTPKGIIKASMKAYRKVGIVRNVIDLMADFACQGIKIQHPVPSKEKFLTKWFEKVKGKDRSERFLNYLYRMAVVAVHIKTGKINGRTESDWKRGKGEDIKLEKRKIKKRSIPLEYNFLNPLSLEVVGGQASVFTGKFIYALKIPMSLKNDLQQLQRTTKTTPLGTMSSDFRKAIQRGQNIVPLDQDKIYVDYYKRDDWNLWADPMVFSIMDDLMLLEKMKLADASALDGAISNIRLWNLGVIDTANPQNSILPTRAGIAKLRNMLANHAGGGTLDLVWGPELRFTESNSQVYKFLGSSKYEATLDSIYDGMGIPAVLRSGSKSGNNTNNFIALKTLTERLKYGRQRLLDFWNEQLQIVAEAMGFTHPGVVVFDQLILSDENMEKQLLLNLADRNYISRESVLEHFGKEPEIEKARLMREAKERGESVIKKAGPFHNPQTDEDLKKIALQGGSVTPSEVGLELEPRKEGEKTRNDEMGEQQLKLAKFKPTGTVNDGRPKNVVETKKRKAKPTVVTQTSAAKLDAANVSLWANTAYQQVSDIVSPAILHAHGKVNLRNLSSAQLLDLEKTKFQVLCNIEPYAEIDTQLVYDIMSGEDLLLYSQSGLVDEVIFNFIATHKRQPTVYELRNIYIAVYTIVQEEADGST